MLQAVTDALGTVIDWVGTVVDALTSSEGALAALLPLLAIGVAISARATCSLTNHSSNGNKLAV